ncbi:DUF1835 domain-containing protein [Ammoniphilus oxalaticus]|uniref:DUF1835 domain-containing protein n=1 Tax=Ammoniphilus oxalaticus TaxID=66863 RepID=UPI001FE973C1|nr:DUF1835 domain-containing protein [Ammoniphilus oxalaticus]
MDDLRESIKKLTDGEARTLLLNLMYRLRHGKEATGIEQAELLRDLFSLFDEIIRYVNNVDHVETNYTAVHLVCGEAAAGSMKVGLGRANQVIGYPDFLQMGPIEQLHTEAGRVNRFEWLLDHLSDPDDYFQEEYRKKVAETLSQIQAIPSHAPIILWTAEDANEQTGLRFLLYLLRDKTNEIFLINATKAYQELYNTDEIQHFVQTDGIEPEKLAEIYQTKRGESPLTEQQRRALEHEWLVLSNSKGVARVWEDDQIAEVDEVYFDEVIKNAVSRLHAEQPQSDFIKAARVIGEVIGHIEQQIGDSFLEYRLRVLVYQGTLEIKGVPKTMGAYRVRLKEECGA